MENRKKVFVGMSGGVDSSVAALLLRDLGYDVVGVYLKSWDGLPTKKGVQFRDQCTWKKDRQDALRVAAKLKIPFITYDFTKEYYDEVIGDFFREFEAGRTPNPDILCNREIKFKKFLEAALKDGADYIATGHYLTLKYESGGYKLYEARDGTKDQSYFLWTLQQEQLKHCLFPLRNFLKSEVRDMAAKAGLATATKKDSQGICFVGQVSVQEFLEARIPVREGAVVTSSNQTVGTHKGASFYTIGQRHGLGIASGLPYYVSGKNVKKNIVYVAEGNSDEALYKKALILENVSWVNEPPIPGKRYTGKLRYRQVSQPLTLSIKNEVWCAEFDEPQRAVTPGQSLVVYDNGEMIGGGIIQ